MKRIRILFLIALVMLYGMPVTAFAQTTPGETTPAVFSLPTGTAGEVYRASIETVLRDGYRLKLETDARTSIFRWAVVSGELPPGLMLRANGIIIGVPRVSRDEPYRFKLKVLDTRVIGGAALMLDFSIVVVARTLRLVEVKMPRLSLISASAPDRAVRGETGDGSPGALAETQNHGDSRFESRAFNKSATIGRSDEEREVNSAVFTRPSLTRVAKGNFVLPAAGPIPTPACDPALEPPAASDQSVLYLDARNGNLKKNDQLVKSTQRFNKGEQFTVVVDNKNPYLNTYTYSSTTTPVAESALSIFVSAITGNLGDLGQPPTAQPTPTTTKENADKLKNPAPGVMASAPACQPAVDLTAKLISDTNKAIQFSESLKVALESEKDKSTRLTGTYNDARLPFFSVNQPRSVLCAASNHLVDVVNHGIDKGTGIPLGGDKSPAPGVDPVALDQIKDGIDSLKQAAETFKKRAQVIREAFPNCLNVAADDSQLIREHLREAEESADKLLANVTNYQQVLDQIRKDLNAASEARKAVQTVLSNQFAFYEMHKEGGFEETNKVDIQLTVTPRQNVAEAQAVAGSPFKAQFTFGGAPFFSISGGLIFSPLRKREFVRLQGFERDQQGNLVLVNGKPNLTTVIGQKENSSMRITPAIFLNGRLSSPTRSQTIDGVYMSLGITAKNDNKGTDVEFLVGPSVSMFDHAMFFTAGGYAGRQQKLVGNLFEGFAVPATVTDLPIQKNYRWNFGFALSYRIPIDKAAK
jgi:hypothetical protein